MRLDPKNDLSYMSIGQCDNVYGAENEQFLKQEQKEKIKLQENEIWDGVITDHKVELIG